MAYYVKIQNPEEFRKDVLGSSHIVAEVLQNYASLLEIRSKKTELLTQLKNEMDELSSLFVQIDGLMPEKQLRGGNDDESESESSSEHESAHEESSAESDKENSSYFDSAQVAKELDLPLPDKEFRAHEPEVEDSDESDYSDQSTPQDISIGDVSPPDTQDASVQDQIDQAATQNDSSQDANADSSEIDKLQSTLDSIQQRMSKLD